MKNVKLLIIALAMLCSFIPQAFPQKLLIPMDLKQTDHLKAYGIAYWTLEQGVNVEWLLNYRGGSFLTDYSNAIERQCKIRGVSYAKISGATASQIYATIEENNMEVVLLEKAPAVAVYQSPRETKWDDAVVLALEYAEIPYQKLWDKEVLGGELEKYDWLHLHHEDFTGQYGKFYRNYRNAPWYIETVKMNEAMAAKLGFKKVSKMKLAVALVIKDYVVKGGFLFSMCSGTDTFDIALAAQNTDICDAVFDGDGIEPGCQAKLAYSKCLAFTGFKLITDPLVYEYSDIDLPVATIQS